MEQLLNVYRKTEMVRSYTTQSVDVCEKCFSFVFPSLECDVKSDKLEDNSGSTSVIVGVVCSLLFLAIGVLLGAVCLCFILRGRGKLSGSAPSSSTPPAVTYEEVGVAREVNKRSQDIQLASNEAYGPVQSRDIQTTQNTAYGQVQL